MIEDDLVSKEHQLEKKIDETKKDKDSWGADKIEMHPLIPHLSRPKDVQKTLKEIGEKIHNKVLNLRKEIFGEDAEDKDEMPHVHVFRLGSPPPFFPKFMGFDK